MRRRMRGLERICWFLLRRSRVFFSMVLGVMVVVFYVMGLRGGVIS